MRQGSRPRWVGIALLLGGLVGLVFFLAWVLLGGIGEDRSREGAAPGTPLSVSPLGPDVVAPAATATGEAPAGAAEPRDAATTGATTADSAGTGAGPWRVPFRLCLDGQPLPGGRLELRRADGAGRVEATADHSGQGEVTLPVGVWELVPADARVARPAWVDLRLPTNSRSDALCWGCEGERSALRVGGAPDLDPELEEELAILDWREGSARLIVEWLGPLVVEGTVLGPGGAPYPGAEVLFSSDALSPGDLGRTRSDARGAFSGRVPGGQLSFLGARIEARAPGLASAWAPLAARGPGEPQDQPTVLRLRAACAVEGAVRDPSGQPLPARVRCTWTARGPSGAVDCEQEVVCDAAGRFRLEGIPVGSAASQGGLDRNAEQWVITLDSNSDGAGPRAAAVKVAARLRGYLPAEAKGLTRPDAPGRVELVLRPAQLVRVRVRGPEGAPLSDARCQLVGGAHELEQASGGSRCGPHGELELTLAVGQPVFAHASAPGHLGAVFELVGPGPHELRLEREGRPLTGRIVEADGRPAAHRDVRVRAAGSATRWTARGGAPTRRLGADELGAALLARGRSDAQGRFSLAQAPEGIALRVETEGVGGEVAPGQREVVLRRPAPLPRPPEGTARLQVVADEDGRPLPGCRLELQADDDGDAEEDQPGVWVLAGQGPVTALVSGPGRVAVPFACTLIPGRDQDLGEVRLPVGGRLRLDLRWLGPLRGARVAWSGADGRGGAWWLSAPGEEAPEPLLLPWGLPPGQEVLFTLHAQPWGQELEETARVSRRLTLAAGEVRTLTCELR